MYRCPYVLPPFRLIWSKSNNSGDKGRRASVQPPSVALPTASGRVFPEPFAHVHCQAAAHSWEEGTARAQQDELSSCGLWGSTCDDTEACREGVAELPVCRSHTEDLPARSPQPGLGASLHRSSFQPPSRKQDLSGLSSPASHSKNHSKRCL